MAGRYYDELEVGPVNAQDLAPPLTQTANLLL